MNNRLSKFGTKSQNLEFCRHKIKAAKILPAVTITSCQWREDSRDCIKKIQFELNCDSWIVRSSCLQEDTFTTSNAGSFLSIVDVTISNLEESIDEVIKSYGDWHEDNQVLIQPMLKNVVSSGVAFSHDPNTCAPYRVINWSEGNDTSIVTGGSDGGYLWQHAAASPYQSPNRYVQDVVILLRELLEVFDDRPLDCEFSFTKTEDFNDLWLLQVRPLLLSKEPQSNHEQHSQLSLLETKASKRFTSHPFLMGSKTVYGVMPDWNPAEIIGVRPKPLAHSLYKELVTDSIWAYQRHNYGYQNLRSFPLMMSFSGLPYIDARVSFNSFIPADLEPNLSNRLVDYYIDELINKPALHDKIEFDIVLSCYSLDIQTSLNRLENNGFSSHDCNLIADSLRLLTKKIIDPRQGLWVKDSQKIDILKKRREILLREYECPIDRIYWLLEDTKRYGTLPFAGLARAGFIAIQMLRSLVNINIISAEEADLFLEGLNTVSRQMTRDKSLLDKSTFLGQYGHLRPGTYDICSPRYDEAFDDYFDWSIVSENRKQPNEFKLSLEKLRELEKILSEHSLEINPIELFDFIKSAIELREQAKFDFTRNLSDALSLMTTVGAMYGYTKDDLSYCDVAAFLKLYSCSSDPNSVLQDSILRGRDEYRKSTFISLPPLISNPHEIWSFQWPTTSPNYITQKQVCAKVVNVNQRDNLYGSIVCIPNADPGFDWLFAHSIAGLITGWGGANSHMAIRAGEIGLPAVIGCGEILFRRWSKADKLSIDCGSRTVRIIS